MKRLFTLIALVGLVAGVFAGCNPSGKDSTAPADTNAPAAPASTNK